MHDIYMYCIKMLKGRHKNLARQMATSRGKKLSIQSSQNLEKLVGWGGGTYIRWLGIAINSCPRASLVAQWLGVHLPMQGIQVQALVREDPTSRGATKPVRHNY